MKRTFITILFSLAAVLALSAQPNVKGRVLADGKPLAGVLVTDGVNFTSTDASGRYAMESKKEVGMVYITTPSGYVAESIDGMRPGFWQYMNLPVEQEEIHDFRLKSENQNYYTVLFAADLHLSNDPERDDLELFKQNTMPLALREYETAKTKGPVYTMNLGDFTHDIYWYDFEFNEADGLRLIQDLGYPTSIYSVMGNHDHDGAIIGEDVDKRAAWIQHNCWGPSAYSVNIGPDHWVFLDDIVYVNVPGKGKKGKNIKGDRSYEQRLTQEQIEWLEKDLSYVSDDTPVYVCVHCPFFKFNGREHSTLVPGDQLAVLDKMAARFTHPFMVYAGHIHKFDFCDHPSYPHLVQRAYPATSGIMWGTKKGWPLISGDGSDAGMCVGVYEAGKAPSYTFKTYEFGVEYFRVYDMNEVGKYYASDPELKAMLAQYPARKNYAKKEYHNKVFVNYWAWEPGDVVEMFENGKPLKVEMKRSEDPLHAISYDLPRMKNHPRPKSAADHMYEAKTRSAKSPVTVRISDRDGNVRYEKTIVRPQQFNPSTL